MSLKILFIIFIFLFIGWFMYIDDIEKYFYDKKWEKAITQYFLKNQYDIYKLINKSKFNKKAILKNKYYNLASTEDKISFLIDLNIFLNNSYQLCFIYEIIKNLIDEDSQTIKKIYQNFLNDGYNKEILKRIFGKNNLKIIKNS